VGAQGVGAVGHDPRPGADGTRARLELFDERVALPAGERLLAVRADRLVADAVPREAAGLAAATGQARRPPVPLDDPKPFHARSPVVRPGCAGPPRSFSFFDRRAAPPQPFPVASL